MPASTWAGQEGALYSVPPALGQTGGCLGRWALRPAVVAPHADVAEQPSLGRQVAQGSQGVAALLHSPSRWRGRAYLLVGVPMGAIPSRQETITIGACLSGWGAVRQGRTVQGQRSAQEGAHQVNMLELRAVQLALTHFLPQLGGKNVRVPWGQHVRCCLDNSPF